ncbi:MAG: hypothetical protein LBN04_06640 [Oscillospiraceae bacterium]|jgi:hypothetical protein|nr:hypothetical protein [Oscillospiraceae bacterium]
MTKLAFPVYAHEKRKILINPTKMLRNKRFSAKKMRKSDTISAKYMPNQSRNMQAKPGKASEIHQKQSNVEKDYTLALNVNIYNSMQTYASNQKQEC